jgi:hypothetical protein
MAGTLFFCEWFQDELDKNFPRNTLPANQMPELI